MSKILKNLFLSLKGQWSLQREFYSYEKYGALLGTFSGHVHIYKLFENTFKYEEEGMHTHLNNYPVKAKQQYVFQYNEIFITKYYFDPMSTIGQKMYDFHFIDESVNKAYGVYSCGQDMYYAHYEFSSKSDINFQYFVKGPKKNYLIQSQLRRKNSIS